MGKIVLRRKEGLKVFSDLAMTDEIFFDKDELEKEIELPVFRSDKYIDKRNNIYLYSDNGGLDTLSVCFRIGKNEYFTETARIIRIKPLKLSYMNQNNSLWSHENAIPYKIPAENNKPVRILIEMGCSFINNNGLTVQYPTTEVIRSKFNFVLSGYGGRNTVYPTELCKKEIWVDGKSPSGAQVEFDKNMIKITVEPNTLNNFSELNGRSKYSIDIYNDDKGRQYPNDADAFDRISGLQFGKSRYDGYWYVNGNEEEMISPAAYEYGTDNKKFSYDYIYKNGIINIGLKQLRKDGVEEEIIVYNKVLDIPFVPRLSYPRIAEWFFYSGHGQSSKQAGINIDENGMKLTSTIKDLQHNVLIKDKLTEKWKGNVKVLILNSCYNANVYLNKTLDTNICSYPSENDIWIDDNMGGSNKGLHNHIYKWFEIIGNNRNDFLPNTAVLGWGKSKIDGVAFGAKDNIGQSPSDKITNKLISFTEPVMNEWNILVISKENPNGIDLAKWWIDAVIKANEKYNNDEYNNKINNNCHNAIAIGTDQDGNCKVFMIEAHKNVNKYNLTSFSKEIRVK